MRKSISFKIFIIFLSFTLSLFLFVGIAIRYFLPEYYKNQKLEGIKQYTNKIEKAFEEDNFDQIYDYFDQLRIEIGGDTYFIDNNGQVNGSAMTRKKSEVRSYIKDDIFEANFINKIGVEIYIFGVKMENGYLIYEVSIQSLEDAVLIMMNFFVYLLLISLLISIISAYLISIKITKPIKELNKLAQSMKSKKIQSVMVSNTKDEIGQLNESLNLLYEELLSNIQRLEAEIKKERAVEKLKKQFLAQAAHELKTPISVIQGYSELIYDGIYKDEVERDHYIESIYNETKNMSKLIRDVLDFSKMETGLFSINKEEIFVNPWVNKIITTYKNYIQLNGLEFKYSNQVGDLCINMDAQRIEQVVKNLLSNAIEHSNGKIELNVSNLNNHLKIEVINSGEPIDEMDIPFIFDSFYKKKGKKTGTGLGLAIVKQIVVLHKGDYRVENTQNGVKFVVII